MMRRLRLALWATALGLAFGAACTASLTVPAESVIPAPTPESELAVATPPLPFVDVTQEAGIHAVHRGEFAMDGEEGYLGVGQAWGDFDNDGWIDLFVTGNLAANALYRNQGDGTFAESVWSAQVAFPDAVSGGAAWADFDNDGWLDLYILNKHANHLVRNLEGQGFEDVTAAAGVGDQGAWGIRARDSRSHGAISTTTAGSISMS